MGMSSKSTERQKKEVAEQGECTHTCLRELRGFEGASSEAEGDNGLGTAQLDLLPYAQVLPYSIQCSTVLV
jgi:hypothetical protein